MTMANTSKLSGRALAQARRRALSTAGKAVLKQQAAPQAPQPAVVNTPAETQEVLTSRKTVKAPRKPKSGRYDRRIAVENNSARKSSLERRRALSSRGKIAQHSKDRVRSAAMLRTPKSDTTQSVNSDKAPSHSHTPSCSCQSNKADGHRTSRPSRSLETGRTTNRQGRKQKSTRKNIVVHSSKHVALARRKALSTRGKAAIHNAGMSQAQTARAANPDLNSRELSKALRAERSKKGKCGQKATPRPSGKVRDKALLNGGAADAYWKVGASKTSHDKTITGTMVDRDQDITGNEHGQCRDITGTEYMGADIFNKFCQTDMKQSVLRTGTSTTNSGNSITGNKVGRSQPVTGEEPGTCAKVTGTEYVGAEQSQLFCNTQESVKPLTPVVASTRKGKSVTGNNVNINSRVTGGEAGANRTLTGAQYIEETQREAPSKVGQSNTIRGSLITGTEVGRATKMTGDEAGSCRHVTGDDYISLEQFQSFCNTQPAPQDQKVGISTSLSGERVTGTLNGRSQRVTGNEPGTCKSVTGTPYAGMDQFSQYCDAPAIERIQRQARPVFKKGANNPFEQAAAVQRAASPSQPEVILDDIQHPVDADAQIMNEQPLNSMDNEENVVHAVATPQEQLMPRQTAVTGTQYDHGFVTGPFGMADGKVTGTDEMRFRHQPTNSAVAPVQQPEAPEMIDGRIKSRISGEGIDAGPKITGDDWDRGERVTGTEGFSSRVRNQTRRGTGGVNAMDFMQRNREVENTAPTPVSRVTGASGNTGNGATITYSGGARG